MRADQCFLLRRGPHLVVRRNMAIGDSVCATVVAQRLTELGCSVTYQTDRMIGPIISRSPHVARVVPTESGPVDVDLDGCYEEHPLRTVMHFHELFFDAAQNQLSRRGISLGAPTNLRPVLAVSHNEQAEVRNRLKQFDRPWVFICPRSFFYHCRTVPDGIWQEAAMLMKGTKFWLGWTACPKGIVDVQNRRMEYLPNLLSVADLLVTVDTGPMHIAAALGVPIVAILQSSAPDLHLTDQHDFTMVAPDLPCLNCQKNVCPKAEYLPPCQNVDPQRIAMAVNRRLRGLMEPTVSAVIPTYRATVERLNRCLDQVLPQVEEVVVTAAADATIPNGALQHPKIRYVRTHKRAIGFGKNVNFGVRHTGGRYVLILNDDVYLAPDAVQKLKEVLVNGVGMVGQLLRYPNNTIAHGGVARAPGSLDWGHIDHGRFEASIQRPVELEQVTAASILVSRRAFYDVGGFDEDFFMYCEDNDLCMRMRERGWSVWYTPHATGIHEGSATSRELPNTNAAMQASIKLFHQRWDWYLEKNRHRSLGTFA